MLKHNIARGVKFDGVFEIQCVFEIIVGEIIVNKACGVLGLPNFTRLAVPLLQSVLICAERTNLSLGCLGKPLFSRRYNLCGMSVSADFKDV